MDETEILESDRAEDTPELYHALRMTMIGPTQHSELIFKVFKVFCKIFDAHSSLFTLTHAFSLINTLIFYFVTLS